MNRDLVDELLAALENLRVLAAEMLDADAVSPPSLKLRGFDNPELGLIRLSSWLFSLHRESAREGVAYLKDGLQLFSCEDEEHFSTVHALRTYFQHHLTSTPDDEKLRSISEDWIRGSEPELDERSDAQWQNALDRLGEQSLRSLSSLCSALAQIASSESSDVIRDQWNVYKQRIIPAHEVDALVARLAQGLGISNLDAKAFRERHNGRWQKSLKVVSARSDPREYLSGLVERDLVSLLSAAPLPVSGDDVIDAFGISPGPQVGRILQYIVSLHSNERLGKRALLERAAADFGLELYLPPE